MKKPFVSIIIATLNSARTLENCLKSIRSQTYPQSLIEIILVDGGSADNTRKIGRKYNCKILVKKGYDAEAAKSFGLAAAKGSIIADFGSDTIIPDKKWLNRLILPFTKDLKIVGSYPLRYTYREKDTVLNKYVALFGINDPVPFYMGKADRQSILHDGYALSGKAVARAGYYEVTFSPRNLPTVGANGFFIRKNILKKAQIAPSQYSHIDVVYDVVAMGYSRFAVVDTGIVHDTADTLWSLMKKRRKYMSRLYLTKKNVRRYHVVNTKNWNDLIHLGLFVLYSLTLIQPLWLSVRGHIKKQDIAWFVHPLFCFLITLVYAEVMLLDFKGLGSDNKP